MSWASGGPDKSQSNRNNIPDLLRARPVNNSLIGKTSFPLKEPYFYYFLHRNAMKCIAVQ